MSTRLKYAAALSTVLLWSTATVISGLLSGRYSVLGIRNSVTRADVFPLVFFILVFGFSIFLPFIIKNRAEFLREFRQSSKRTRVYALLLGALVPGYMLTYYYALLFSPPLNAYVLIYLWPIFLFLFSKLPSFLVSKRQAQGNISKASLNELFMLVLAFFGSALVIQESKGEAVASRHIPGYISAGCSSVLIALTFFSVNACASESSAVPSSRRGFSKNYYVYFIACVVGIVLLAISILITGQRFRLNSSELAGAAWLGCIVFATAHLLWTFAIRMETSKDIAFISRLTALIYFTPVVSALILYFAFSERLTSYTVLGISLVILGNFFIQGRYTYISAVTGASTFAVIAGAFCYLTTNVQSNSDVLALYSFLSTLFAIVNGFTLTRLAGKRSNELQHIGEISKRLELIRLTLAKGLKDKYEGTAEKLFTKNFDLLFRWIIDIDFGVRCETREETILKVNNVLRNFERMPGQIKKAVPSAQSFSTYESIEQVAELKRVVDAWIEAKFSRIHIGESAANWLLGILTIASLIFYRGNSFFGDILATFASPVVIFLLLAMRDYSSGRVEKDFLSIVTMQRKFIRVGDTFYLPKKIVLNQDFILPPREVKVRYSDTAPCLKNVDDQFEYITMPGESSAWHWVVRIIILIILGFIIFLLYGKHS